MIGFSNMFLQAAVAGWRMGEEWRDLHTQCAQQVEPGYLFHANRRDCWAVIVRVGESGDVTFVPGVRNTTPATQADRADQADQRE